MKSFVMGDRRIGPPARCFVIAEAGVNHNGRRDLAFRLVDAAAAAGADAVKFQTFKADRLVTREAPKAAYQMRSGRGSTQYEMLKALELSEADHVAIMRHCRRKRILFLSTPFDEESADLLARLGVPAFKLGSGELTNLPLLRHVARKGRPVILSSGMATLDEVMDACRCVRRHGAPHLAVLHCVSNYPADPATVNLRAMQTMAEALKCPIGFSDHTAGTDVALAAVALGASIVEKHLTLSRSMKGPDHKSSSTPAEFARLVAAIRRVESALGDGVKNPSPTEAGIAAAARRSVVAARDIPRGARICAADLELRRPGTGMRPAQMRTLIGRRARRDISAGQLLALDMTTGD